MPLAAAIPVYTSRASVGMGIGATLALAIYVLARLGGYSIERTWRCRVLDCFTVGRALASLRRNRADRGSDARVVTIYKARAVYIGDRRTTLRLAPVMWDALRDIALYRSLSLAELLLEIEESCDPGEGLADAIRIYIVKFYRSILADVMSQRQRRRH